MWSLHYLATFFITVSALNFNYKSVLVPGHDIDVKQTITSRPSHRLNQISITVHHIHLNNMSLAVANWSLLTWSICPCWKTYGTCCPHVDIKAFKSSCGIYIHLSSSSCPPTWWPLILRIFLGLFLQGELSIDELQARGLIYCCSVFANCVVIAGIC